jgi:rubrerythrin
MNRNPRTFSLEKDLNPHSDRYYGPHKCPDCGAVHQHEERCPVCFPPDA